MQSMLSQTFNPIFVVVPNYMACPFDGLLVLKVFNLRNRQPENKEPAHFGEWSIKNGLLNEKD